MSGEGRMTKRSTLTVDEGDLEKEDKQEERSVSPARSLRRSASSPGPNESVMGNKRPKDTAFRQQRLPAWQPILTPYNVIPTLFIMALVFIPVGITFLVFSAQVQEYTFDYTTCLNKAPVNNFVKAPESLGNVPFEWRRLSSLPDYASRSSIDFDVNFTPSSTLCELRFLVEKPIDGPVFQYYRLSNFYQNQRLYVKSVDWDQLKGEAKDRSQLGDCTPLIGPDDSDNLVYYPCGLIANSMFNDTIGGMVRLNGDIISEVYTFPPKGIAWSSDSSKYGPTKYSKAAVRPPPFWANNRRLVKKDGTYEELPNLQADERFQNWMKVAGLPIFRKTYGKTEVNIAPGTYTVLISSTYEVESYGAKKALVISNTSWIGGKNPFLGWAYVTTGAIFLTFGITFLIRHLMAPRRLGDVSFLSWNQSASTVNNISTGTATQ